MDPRRRSRSACCRNHARSFSWFDAFVTVRKRCGPEAVGEEIVEHPRRRPCRGPSTARRPRRSFSTLLERMRWRNRSASGPVVSTSPMWLTSNTPTASHGRHMLGAGPPVLHRHLPTRERNEPRARRGMAIVKRRAFERFGARGHSRPDPSSGYDPSRGVHSRADASRDAGVDGDGGRSWPRVQTGAPSDVRGDVRRGRLQCAGRATASTTRGPGASARLEAARGDETIDPSTPCFGSCASPTRTERQLQPRPPPFSPLGDVRTTSSRRRTTGTDITQVVLWRYGTEHGQR